MPSFVVQRVELVLAEVVDDARAYGVAEHVDCSPIEKSMVIVSITIRYKMNVILSLLLLLSFCIDHS